MRDEILRLRDEHPHWTRQQVADHLGVSYATIDEYAPKVFPDYRSGSRMGRKFVPLPELGCDG